MIASMKDVSLETVKEIEKDFSSCINGKIHNKEK